MEQEISAPQLLKSNKLLLKLLAVSFIFLMLVSQPKWNSDLLTVVLFFLGFMLVFIGMYGRIYCSVYIGAVKGRQIVSDGPFSIVRNPLYLFSFIALLGVCLQSGYLITPFFLCGFTFLYYAKIIVPSEEKFLAQKFGDVYVAYMKDVPPWIPNLKLWREPKSIVTYPWSIRSTMEDAFYFFLIALVFVAINVLHKNNVLPVWFFMP